MTEHPGVSAPYLIVATNEVWILINRHRPPTLPDLAQAASLCCGALADLVHDQEFQADVERMAQAWTIERAGVTELLDPRTQHLELFLNRLERDLLISIGLNVSFVDSLIEQARSTTSEVRRLRQRRSGIGWTELSVALSVLRTEACELAAALSGGPPGPGHPYRSLRLVALGIGGAAMIAVNAGAVVATNDLSAAGSAVSGAIGSILLSDAAGVIRRSKSDQSGSGESSAGAEA